MPTTIDGTTGASQIQDGTVTEAKIAAGAVTETKIAAGAVTAEKLAVGVISTTSVLAATAGASSGAVGTYIVAWNATTTVIAVGGTIAGSNLRNLTSNGEDSPFSTQTNSSTLYPGTGAALSGTWRAITHGGGRRSTSNGYAWDSALWLRIS
jgi:hypothetical protein